MFYFFYGGLYFYMFFKYGGGILVVNDYCMVVGVNIKGFLVYGWRNNGYVNDCLSSDFDWFNKLYKYGFFYLMVWFK